jgi:hypothetical protein
VQNCTHRFLTNTASQSITRRENPPAALEGNRANGSLKVKHVACIHSWPMAVPVGAAAVVQLVQVYHRDSRKPVQPRAAPRRLKYKPRPYPDAHPLPLCTATSLNLYYYRSVVLPARPRRGTNRIHGSAMEAAAPQQLPFTSVWLVELGSVVFWLEQQRWKGHAEEQPWGVWLSSALLPSHTLLCLPLPFLLLMAVLA